MSTPSWDDTTEIQPHGFDKPAFRNAIGSIESNKKYNTVGPEIDYGLDKGKHAVGKYQFTPSTIDTLAKHSKDKEIAGLHGLPDEDKEQLLLNNPSLQDKLFDQQVDYLQQRVGSDPLKLAFAHNQGPGNIENFDAEHDYVQKFAKAYKPSQATRNIQSSPKFDDTKGAGPKFEDTTDINQPTNPEGISTTGSMVIGGAQGLTGGFYDELAC